MAKYYNGPNGPISGKLGDIVGSSWRGIHYVKNKAKTSTKPKTEKQLAQQARFALAVQFLRPIKELLNIGFKQHHRAATGFNMAVKYILQHAIIGQYPEYTIDYQNVQFSQGSWGRAEVVKLMPGAAFLTVIWYGNQYRFSSYGDDQVNILIYEPVSNEYVKGPADVLRMQEACIIAIPPRLCGKPLHTYLFCVSSDGKVSDTTYAGEIIVS